MKVIGLCGGSGSGKGTVSTLFEKFGIHSIDTDAVYHDLTSKRSACLDALVERFGKDILTNDGALDRRALADIVFNGADSQEKREALNKIAHKFVLMRAREILAEYKEAGMPAAIVDAPLLFESGFDKECDVIIAVIADQSTRIERIMKRDGITKEYATARIRAQLSDEYLKERADYVINNSNGIGDTDVEVAKIAKKILDTEI